MCAPELQRIAIRVLSQTTSASNCERNWSTFSLIHTKTRNRLKYARLQKLVFVHYNMRLKLRHTMRRSQQEIDDSFNPVNLDYIFEEDDPLTPWLEEREQPLLDGQDNSNWLDEEVRGTAEGGDQPPINVHNSSSSPERTQSDDNLGLSPPSDDDGGGDGDSGAGFAGNIGGDAQYGYGHETDTSFVGDTYHAGRYGLQDIPENYDLGIPPEYQTSQPRRRSHWHRNLDSTGDSYGMLRNFGDFNLQESSSESYGSSSYHPPPQHYDPYHTYHPYPSGSGSGESSSTNYPSTLAPAPTYGYGHGYDSGSGYSQGEDFGPPPISVGFSPPVYFQEQPRNDTNLGFFSYVFPQGWGDANDSQSQSQNRDEDTEEPARHSFWW